MMWGFGSGMYGMGWGEHMLFGGIFWLILLVVGGYAAISLYRGQDRGAPRKDAIDTLDERYARGEIGREEYLEKRSDLATAAKK